MAKLIWWFGLSMDWLNLQGKWFFDYLARSRGERLLMLLSVRFKLERRGK